MSAITAMKIRKTHKTNKLSLGFTKVITINVKVAKGQTKNPRNGQKPEGPKAVEQAVVKMPTIKRINLGKMKKQKSCAKNRMKHSFFKDLRNCLFYTFFLDLTKFVSPKILTRQSRHRTSSLMSDTLIFPSSSGSGK
jgi:hypothetical protein